MSYDLFFHTPKGTPPLGRDAFEAYFSARAHYTVDDEGAWYQHEDTGVYFSFRWRDGSASAATFNLNYFRPRVFGLEAEPEVSAFVSHFGLEIDDPQSEGMGSGPYSAEGFLRGWGAGNTAAHEILIQQGKTGEPLLVLPRDVLERTWRWNRARGALQDRYGNSLFVPRISYFADAGRVLTFAVWTEASPIALPEVDLLMLVRDVGEPHQSVAVVSAASLASIVESFPHQEDGALSYRLLDYDLAPEQLVAAFNDAPTHERGETQRTVRLEELHDADLVNAG
jgi:hypothetical protein